MQQNDSRLWTTAPSRAGVFARARATASKAPAARLAVSETVIRLTLCCSSVLKYLLKGEGVAVE